MFFLCGHKGLIPTAFTTKMESILFWQTCRPIAGSKSGGGGVCERHLRCSGVSNIHFISRADLVRVLGKMNSSVLTVGGGRSSVTENWALKSIREGVWLVCAGSTCLLLTRWTGTSLTHTDDWWLNKIWNTRFSFRDEPASLEILFSLANMTKKRVWTSTPHWVIVLHLGLTSACRPMFAKYPKLTHLLTILSFMNDL